MVKRLISSIFRKPFGRPISGAFSGAIVVSTQDTIALYRQNLAGFYLMAAIDQGKRLNEFAAT